MNAILVNAMCTVTFFVTLEATNSQEVSTEPAFRIVSCDAKFVGYTYSPTGGTATMPSHTFGDRSGFVYEVTIVVGPLSTVQSSRDPFGVICRLPDGTIKGVILNRAETVIEGVVSNPFVFQIQTREKGLATFEIGTLNAQASEVTPIPNVPEDSKSSVFLE
jgi:hypothetical protein